MYSLDRREQPLERSMVFHLVPAGFSYRAGFGATMRVTDDGSENLSIFPGTFERQVRPAVLYSPPV